MPRPSYSANFPDVDEPTLKRKRPTEDTAAPPNNKKLRAMSNVVQREFEAELRAERYKAKYLKTIDVLPKRTGELKQVKADLQDTKAELEESKILNAQLKARNAELEDMSRAVHEQTTRDIVEAREAAKEARREADRVRRDAEEWVEEVRRDTEAYVQKHAQEVASQLLADQAQTQTGNDEQYLAYIAQLQAHNDYLTNSLSAASSSLSSSFDAIQAKHTRAIYAFAVFFYIKYPMDWPRIVRNFRPLAEAVIVGNVSEGYRHPDDVRWDVVPDRGEEEGEETTLERAEGGVEEEEEEEEMEEEEVVESVHPPQGTTYDRARDPRLRKAADNFLDDMAASGALPGFGQQAAFGQSSAYGAASGSGFGASSAFEQPPAYTFAQSAFVQPAPTSTSAFAQSTLGQPFTSTSAFNAPSSTLQPSSAFAQPGSSAPASSSFGAGSASTFASQPAPPSAAPVPVQRQPTTKEINTSGYATE